MMVYSAHEVTAPNMKSSPAPMPAEAMLAMSPREITIHTPNSAMATPSQRRALRCSLSTSAEIVMVITGIERDDERRAAARQPLERGHEEQVVGEHAECPEHECRQPLLARQLRQAAFEREGRHQQRDAGDHVSRERTHHGRQHGDHVFAGDEGAAPDGGYGDESCVVRGARGGQRHYAFPFVSP